MLLLSFVSCVESIELSRARLGLRASGVFRAFGVCWCVPPFLPPPLQVTVAQPAACH